MLALDVLEHLRSPEDGVRKIAEILKPRGRLYASTGNIAFHVMRLSLVLGQFNYGKRGILDLTHTRLFTISSFKQLLVNGGFIDQGGARLSGHRSATWSATGPFLRATDSSSGLLARLWPRLFAFSFLVVAEKADELEDVYARTLPPPAAPRQTGRTGAGVTTSAVSRIRSFGYSNPVRGDAGVEQGEGEERRRDGVPQTECATRSRR